MGRKSRLKAIKRSLKKEKSNAPQAGASKEMRDASTQTSEETQIVLVPTDDPQALTWDIQQMPKATTEETILGDVIDNKNNVLKAGVLEKPLTKKSLNK